MAPETNVYPLGRDLMASMRLNIQHHHWISETGFLLHPSIPIPSSPPLLIADIGCGTGIWSLDLSAKHPTSRIESHDISLSQTPPEQWWPSNVTFHQTDILSPLPPHLLGRYDIVHIRLFMCVVQNNDPSFLLSQLLKLLKPGGHLQWQEYDTASDSVVVAAAEESPDSAAPKLVALRKALYAVLSAGSDEGGTGLTTNWVSTLHERFEGNGEDGARLVAHERKALSHRFAILRQEISFLSVREICTGLAGKSPETAERLSGMLREAEEECWAGGRGAMVDSRLITWVIGKGEM